VPGANWFPPRTDNTLRSAEESDVCGGEKEVTQQVNYSILSCNQLTGVHGSTRSVRFLKNHVALKLLETRCSLLSCMYRQDASLHLRNEEGRRGGEERDCLTTLNQLCKQLYTQISTTINQIVFTVCLSGILCMQIWGDR